MRDIYVWFSIIYFIMGGLSLYMQYKSMRALENIAIQVGADPYNKEF